jgi:hypothetical protein
MKEAKKERKMIKEMKGQMKSKTRITFNANHLNTGIGGKSIRLYF